MKFGWIATVLCLMAVNACTVRRANQDSMISEDQSALPFYKQVIRYDDLAKYPINDKGTILYVYSNKSCSDCVKLEKNVLNSLASENKSADDYLIVLIKAGVGSEKSDAVVKEFLDLDSDHALPTVIIKNNGIEQSRFVAELNISSYRSEIARIKARSLAR